MNCSSREYSSSHSKGGKQAVCRVWVCQIDAMQRHWVRMLQHFLAQWFLLPVWVRMATHSRHGTHRLWRKHYCWSLAARHSWTRVKLYDVKKQKILEGRNTRSYTKNALLQITASWVCGCTQTPMRQLHKSFRKSSLKLSTTKTHQPFTSLETVYWFLCVLHKFNLYLLNIQSLTQGHPLCYFHICLLSCFPASSLCLDRVLCRLWTWLTSGQWPVCRPPADAAFSRCVVG